MCAAAQDRGLIPRALSMIFAEIGRRTDMLHEASLSRLRLDINLSPDRCAVMCVESL